MAANLSNIRSIIPRLNANILVQNCVARRCFASSVGASDAPYSSNDEIAPRIRNRNPMNLEMMQLGKNSNINIVFKRDIFILLLTFFCQSQTIL